MSDTIYFDEIIKYYWYNRDGNPIDPRDIPHSRTQIRNKGYKKELIRSLAPSSSSGTVTYNGPENAAAANRAAAALIPLTPRGPKLPLDNGNNLPKKGCFGKACNVVTGWFKSKKHGGRKTRRAKSRRAKTRRARRS